MARFVTRSNHQEPGIDYNKSFQLLWASSLPGLLVIAAISDLGVIQFDITSPRLQNHLRRSSSASSAPLQHPAARRISAKYGATTST
jgi:hypothetical protein